MEMEKKYSPKEFEQRVYKSWMEKGLFEAHVNKDKKPFTIVLPPPNITGQLHMGHALDHSIQDALIRFKRMQGFEALWLPGTDHASIATEVKVLERIKEDSGRTKEDLTREEFLEKAWQWKEEYGSRIVDQMMKLGNSCDWSKERFTMDEGCNDAVTEVFVDLYEKGLIYRGNRLINWCPDCKTTLSDAEVEHEEKQGKFYFIKYKVENEGKELIIATTRPETMLGDTAIAVNPNDERYKNYIGKYAILPIVGRRLPIIADEYVDIELGTGALKVTPSHDPNDFELGNKHNLEFINVLNDNGTMNENAGEFIGLDRFDCRKKIIEKLKEIGSIHEIKEHNHNVGTCYRCSTIIEPKISDQWFVAMESLAKPSIDALKNKDMEIIPNRFDKVYFHWLENIRDWCISRQLWWGHRIPAYYCNSCNHMMVSKEEINKCDVCHSTNVRRDEDVLDTWFSSALWPFSTLGWPSKTPELEYFYPTDVLVTGYDIIFFWVIRMMFSGLEQMKEVPFKYTLIHGLVRDAQGRKMSKSLGNGVDPLDLIDQYGADALRFMLLTGNSPGNDIRFQIERVESSRNFANKLWNASRFVIMNLDDNFEFKDFDNLELSDKWILSELNIAINEITENLEKFEIGIAADKIYHFIWDNYCDWYIESTKPRLYSDNKEVKNNTLNVLVYVLENILKLLHPFMPFITEEIYTFLPNRSTELIISNWPLENEAYKYEIENKQMNWIMESIKNIRNIRVQMDVPNSRKARLIVNTNESMKNIIESSKEYYSFLAQVSEIEFTDLDDIKDSVALLLEGAKFFIPLDDLIDYKKELDRLNKEKIKFEQELERAKSKLTNESFISKAPQKLIDEEKAKVEKFISILKETSDRIESIKNKA